MENQHERQGDWMDRLAGSDGREFGRLRAGPDLRRRRRGEGAEAIVDAAQFLPPGERVLIESVFRDGRAVSDVARLISGLTPGRDAQGRDPGQCPERSLRSRVRRVVRRIQSREYQVVGRWLAMEKLGEVRVKGEIQRQGWVGGWVGVPGGMRRRVAIACFVHGLSLRKAAELLGLTLHEVRRHRDAVAALIESAARAGESGGGS